MTNNTKTIDISEIPLTDRLSVGRQLEKNNGHAEYMGRRVVIGTVHKVKDGPRSSGELLHALAQARLSKAPKVEKRTEEYAVLGEFVHGVGFVRYDENS